MKMRNAKSIFLISSATLTTLLFAVNYFYVQNIDDNVKRLFLERDMRILLFFAMSLLVSGAMLYFVNDTLFRNWCKRILSWYLPVAVAITATGSEGSIMNPAKDTFAFFFGALLVLLTVFFIAWNLFSDWRKQKQISGK